MSDAHASGRAAVVILAAGKGTRMKSALPKPLHRVAGRPMVAHVLAAATVVDPVATVLVVSPELADLPARITTDDTRLSAAIQDPPLGTGDAVRQALPHIGDAEWLLVFFADHPRLDGDTVRALLDGARASCARVTVLTAVLSDPAGYGRIDRDDAGRVIRIVERKDDDPAKRIGAVEINSGMMAIDAGWAREAFTRLTPSPATGEYYLTELVELAVAEGAIDGAWPVATVAADPRVALGINDRVELAAADADLRQRIRERHMRAGVTIVGPETVFIDEGVVIGTDTTLLPGTIITGTTVIGRDCEIGPYAVLRDATIGDGARVTASVVSDSRIGDHADAGPWSHLRNGAQTGDRSHVGNFVEMKNSNLGPDAKSGHVSYLGDADIGARANIGAGTITANWDGIDKHRTVIGEEAFIGVDTILRAPVTVGARARTGAGAVVLTDVPEGVTVAGVPAKPLVKEAHAATTASTTKREEQGG